MVISTRCLSWPMNVEGNADERMSKTAAVAPEIELFFIEAFTMIGTDDDDGIFKKTFGFQYSKDSSDLFIGIVQGVFVAVDVGGGGEVVVECQMVHGFPVGCEKRFLRGFREGVTVNTVQENEIKERF